MIKEVPPAAEMQEGTVPRHHQLIVTLFGLYARTPGAGIPVATIIRLLQDAGVGPAGVRSSISRLKKRGVLESVTVQGRSGYALSSGMQDTFREGDERIFHPRRAGIEDPWLLATFTVPESQRNIRHKIRSSLVRMGFGSVTPGLWIAPGHLRPSVLSYFENRGMGQYLEFFLADHVGSSDMRANVAQWWDLPALELQYAEFIRLQQPLLERWLDGGQPVADRMARAFVDHLLLLTEWRRLPYLDPGLPVELLSKDWNALEAHDLFSRLHSVLGPLAEEHATAVIDDVP
ncbi:PaaX family transcriptional regulator C-terminal domain-containing protein [Arthrobacter sp. zg-Y1143]|uniref:PaaX family transcriptional regulator n=1 Tax=Arthrobacter sp. zg-Y1143 TaxID=3049065 RepID=UPI0024C351EA|nr:PaaX family transcriptional regulator C-terminal domain-containing protein [Arthrobacter sp. zg-Y1143]MDK1326592.1 PaaX family transcriptional regulator C-terminal domain-containing protein [Arthrobacter sp. zg-Y1143]